MSEKLQLVVVDCDQAYSRAAEAELIRRFAADTELYIITDPIYMERFFRSRRKIDVLLTDKRSSDDLLAGHGIESELLFLPDDAPALDLTARTRVIRASEGADGILQAVEEAVRAGIARLSGGEGEGRPQTRLVAVYSPIGGCGKSLAALSLARKLKKLDQKVLLVG